MVSTIGTTNTPSFVKIREVTLQNLGDLTWNDPYAIMVYGLGNSLGSFISGKLLSLGAKSLVVLGTLVLHLSILIFLAIWEREPILLAILFIVLLWGFCDGSWMTVCSSKCTITITSTDM